MVRVWLDVNLNRHASIVGGPSGGAVREHARADLQRGHISVAIWTRVAMSPQRFGWQNRIAPRTKTRSDSETSLTTAGAHSYTTEHSTNSSMHSELRRATLAVRKFTDRHCVARQSPFDSAVGNPFAGLWTGAREVLRTLSYYEMKNRAGLVGQQGLGPLLANLAGPGGAPRIHLIGHSFGARLVCRRPVRC